jgi:cyclopropane fatty-acyl-phospholipid synthase-like methyltransferase
LTNLVPVQASADAANLPEAVDVVLVVDTYHHIGNRTQYFAKLKSSLRPMGRVAIVDFKADSPSGSAHAASHFARKSDGRTQRGRLLAHGDASIPVEAILPRLPKA